MKARAIPCTHQPLTRGDNTVSVAQGGTAIPGATKQLLPRDRVFKRIIYIYIYTPDQLKTGITLHVYLHFLCSLWFLKNAFTFGRWCHYTLTVTVSWRYVITREWWFRVHFIHTAHFLLSIKSNFMHIALWSNGASAFSVPILTFLSVSVEMIDCSESDNMIEICGKLDEPNT